MHLQPIKCEPKCDRRHATQLQSSCMFIAKENHGSYLKTDREGRQERPRRLSLSRLARLGSTSRHAGILAMGAVRYTIVNGGVIAIL